MSIPFGTNLRAETIMIAAFSQPGTKSTQWLYHPGKLSVVVASCIFCQSLQRSGCFNSVQVNFAQAFHKRKIFCLAKPYLSIRNRATATTHIVRIAARLCSLVVVVLNTKLEVWIISRVCKGTQLWILSPSSAKTESYCILMSFNYETEPPNPYIHGFRHQT